MIRGIVVGVLTVAAVAALAIFVVYPFVFTTISGLFDNPDVGTIAGIVMCVIVTGPLYVVGMFLALLLGAVTAAFLEK